MDRLDKLKEILDSYEGGPKSQEHIALERQYVAETFPGFKDEDITRFCAIESEDLKGKLCFMKDCVYAGQEGPNQKDWYDDALAAMLDKGTSLIDIENWADEELDGLK